MNNFIHIKKEDELNDREFLINLLHVVTIELEEDIIFLNLLSPCENIGSSNCITKYYDNKNEAEKAFKELQRFKNISIFDL